MLLKLPKCLQLKRTWLFSFGGWKTRRPPSGSRRCRSENADAKSAFRPDLLPDCVTLKLRLLLSPGAGGSPEACRDPGDLRQPGDAVAPLQGPSHFREEEGLAVSGGAAGRESPPTIFFRQEIYTTNPLLASPSL